MLGFMVVGPMGCRTTGPEPLCGPQHFENSVCGPWLKKFVHHCCTTCAVMSSAHISDIFEFDFVASVDTRSTKSKVDEY